MKILISIVLVLLSATLAAQNVGINQPNPTQPLDVNGNVNVGGNLLVSGTPGAAGQVLSTTTSGATAWLNTGNLPNIGAFTQSGTFTVPAGITTMMVEAWVQVAVGLRQAVVLPALILYLMKRLPPGRLSL